MYYIRFRQIILAKPRICGENGVVKRIMTIVGARPQFVKAAAISRLIRDRRSQEFSEYLVHTGQHYSENMSAVFFDELMIPEPDVNLGIGSFSHGKQTGYEKLQ